MRWWLIAARKNMGLTQAQFSKKAGICAPNYCHIELGKIDPKPATAKKIAAVLGMDWTRFYDDDEGK